MKAWFLDMVERTVATYAQSFIGLLCVSQPLNLKAVEAALVAAIPAALAVIKAALARFVGDPDSASLVRGVVDPKC